MSTDVTLGQYFPGKSFVHKLDPRVKLLLTLSYMIIAFFCNNFILLAILLITLIFIICVSKVPLRLYLKSMKTLLAVIIFTSVINLFYGSGVPLLEFGFLKITKDGIYNSAFVATRLIAFIFISSTLTFVTSPSDLTFAIENVLKPLSIFKVKVHDIAMMMTIALRFVPTLLEESLKIMDAQKARGVDLETKNIIKKAKALVPILIPLFVSSFRCAYDLAIAMECRCYNSEKKRTALKTFKIGKNDVIAIILTAVFALIIVKGSTFC